MSGDRPKGMEIYLVKLGGSLITDKKQPETPRNDVISRLSAEICELRTSVDSGLIIGHGSGSFGHRAAERYGIHRGISSTEQLPGVGVTQSAAARLHALVFQNLLEAEVPAYSLAPSSFLVASEDRAELLWPEPVLLALDLGLVPAVYGDVVMNREWGTSICSTETLFLALAPALASRGRFVKGAVWLGETEGVFDSSGRVIPEIDPDEVEALASGVDGASGVDVTGGMRHRLQAVETLARLGIPSWIGNGLVPGNLIAAVHGDVVGGTWVRAGR